MPSRPAACVFVAAALVVALAPGQAPASQTAGQDSAREGDDAPTVTGRVVDEAGLARASALVIAVGTRGDTSSPSPRFADKRRLYAAVTDASGRFEFSKLPPGRYVLLAIHGHHSPGHSDPVVVGNLGIPFPLKLTLGGPAPII